MARKAKASEPPADVEARKLVALVDGPMQSHWYYLDDWQERRRAALRMGHTPHTNTNLAYVPVKGATVPHPKWDGVTGHALAYAPDVAAAAMAGKHASTQA